MDESLYSKEALKKIDQALLSGVRSVSFGEKTISFHSLDELIKLRNQIARFMSGKDIKRQYFPRVDKGC